MRLDRLLRTLSQYVTPAPTRTETRGTTAAMIVETILTIVRDLDNPLHGEVRRARFGPGLRPGPRRQARWAGRRLQGQRRAIGASRAAGCEAPLRHPMRLSCQVALVNLLSGCGGQLSADGECDGFVVVLAGDQAVVQAAEQAAEQVALGGGVPVAGVFAPVVVGAGAG